MRILRGRASWIIRFVASTKWISLGKRMSRSERAPSPATVSRAKRPHFMSLYYRLSRAQNRFSIHFMHCMENRALSLFIKISLFISYFSTLWLGAVFECLCVSVCLCFSFKFSSCFSFYAQKLRLLNINCNRIQCVFKWATIWMAIIIVVFALNADDLQR